MRLVYTADLHGNLALYRALGEAALGWEADAVIIGGDLCPGSRPFESQPQAHAEFIRRDLASLLAGWKRERPSLRVLAIPGNDDFQTVLQALGELEQAGLLESLHRRVLRLDSCSILGLAFVPPTPFSIKDFERRDTADPVRQTMQPFRCVIGTDSGIRYLENFQAYLEAEPSIEEELARLDGLLGPDPGSVIGVLHSPPANTCCDLMLTRQHVGSRAVREWVERRQPLLTLHGHIHESPQMTKMFADRIGSTWVVNPGSDKQHLHLVFIDTENVSAMEHSLYGQARLPGNG
ncbi:MAG: metallophosphoesterase [candidate division NC10 bacterium]